MKKKIIKKIIALMLFVPAFALSQVGIGTANPNNSALLHLESSNKGFLPPRTTLLSETDAVTIPNPAKGLVVYHTSNTISGEGLYTNIGTSANPKWSLLQMVNSSAGALSGKMMQTGVPDSNKILSVGNYEFRLRVDATTGIFYFEMRLKKAPSVATKYFANRSAWYGVNTFTKTENVATFTPADWNNWKQIDSAGYLNGTPAGSYSFLNYISSVEDPSFIELHANTRYGAGLGPENQIWQMAVFIN